MPLAFTRAQELGSFGLMFYNCLFSLPVIVIYVLLDTEKLAAVREFDKWTEPGFLINYLLSCIMGYACSLSHLDTMVLVPCHG